MRVSKVFLASATALAAVLTAGGALAQDDQTEVDAVVVTGSRIARQDFVSESPIVTVSRQQIQAVGMTTIENTLNQLPQFTPSNGAGTNTTNFVSTPGQAYSNLRGLGPTRTLVLIDGRRVVAGNPNNVVDLNTIPTFLVDSIETITGGASAVYGSDAVAGVVNFKLRTEYEGFEADVQYGQTDRGDAGQTMAAFTAGTSFGGGRGNVMGAITYDKREGLLASDRDWAEIGYSILNTGLTPSGAATIPDGRFDPSSNAGGAGNLPSQAAMNTIFGGYGFAAGTVTPNSSLSFNADGTLFTTAPVRNFKGEQVPGFSASSYTFNSAPYRYLNLPLERYSLFAAADFDVADRISAYGTVSYTTYDVSRQLGPASASDGAFPGPDIVVPVTNPFIPADLKFLLDSRANPTAAFYPRRAFTEVGGRLSENTYETFQLVGGLRGDIVGDWRWDAYLSFGEMNHVEDQFGNVSRAAMRELTFAPDGGVAICGGFNIFGAGKVSAGCADYISRDVTNETTIRQWVLEANATGTLFTLPTGPVKASVGVQARSDRFDYDPDALLQGPDIVGFNPAVPIVGRINSRELYGEVLVPLFTDADGFGELELNLGGRLSEYNTVGSTSAWKADLTWRLFDNQILLRGGAQRAVRAPNIAELYSPQSLGFLGIGTPGLGTTAGDPCDISSSYRNGANAAAVKALCLTQGVPSAVIDTYHQASTQVEVVTGGNPDLSEETADSVTAGIVWRPRLDHPLLNRLSVALDWYEIEVADMVGTLGVSTIVGACFNSDGSNPTFDPGNFYCQQFSRLGAGTITSVVLTQVNLAGMKTSGWDFQVDWGFALGDVGLPEGAGSLGFNLVYSKLDSFERQIRPGADFIDYAGSIGADLSGSALPEQKWLLSTTWEGGPAKVTFRWRHIDGMTDARSIPVFSPTALNAPDYDIYDLMGSWQFDERVTVRVGVNNLTDEDPPYYTSYSNSNTDPSTYDVLGRRWFIGLNAKF